PMWERIFCPTSRLEDSDAVIDKSNNTPASTASLSCSLTLPAPPIKSERFSLSANQRAVSEVAPLSDRAKTEAPKAAARGAASACTETNKSAPFTGDFGAAAQRNKIVTGTH